MSKQALYTDSLHAFAQRLRQQARYPAEILTEPDDSRMLGNLLLHMVTRDHISQRGNVSFQELLANGLTPDSFRQAYWEDRDSLLDILHELTLEDVYSLPTEAAERNALLDAPYNSWNGYRPGYAWQYAEGMSTRDVVYSRIEDANPALARLGWQFEQARTQALLAELGARYDCMNTSQREAFYQQLLQQGQPYPELVQRAQAIAEESWALQQDANALQQANAPLLLQAKDILDGGVTSLSLRTAEPWLRELMVRTMHELGLRQVFEVPVFAVRRDALLQAEGQEEKWRFLTTLQNEAYGLGWTASDIELQTSLNMQFSTHERGTDNPAMGAANRLVKHNPAIHSQRVKSLVVGMFDRAQEMAKAQGASAEVLDKLDTMRVQSVNDAEEHDRGELGKEPQASGNLAGKSKAELRAHRQFMDELEGAERSHHTLWHAKWLQLKQSGLVDADYLDALRAFHIRVAPVEVDIRVTEHSIVQEELTLFEKMRNNKCLSDDEKKPHLEKIKHLQQRRDALASQTFPFPPSGGEESTQKNYLFSTHALDALWMQYHSQIPVTVKQSVEASVAQFTEAFERFEHGKSFLKYWLKPLERTDSQKQYADEEFQAGGKPITLPPRETMPDGSKKVNHDYMQWKLMYVIEKMIGLPGGDLVDIAATEADDVTRQANLYLMQASLRWFEVLLHRVADDLAPAFAWTTHEWNEEKQQYEPRLLPGMQSYEDMMQFLGDLRFPAEEYHAHVINGLPTDFPPGVDSLLAVVTTTDALTVLESLFRDLRVKLAVQMEQGREENLSQAMAA